MSPVNQIQRDAVEDNSREVQPITTLIFESNGKVESYTFHIVLACIVFFLNIIFGLVAFALAGNFAYF